MPATNTRAGRRLAAGLTALALTLSLALPAAAAETASPLLEPVRTYAGQFADLSGVWCAEEAVAVYETGLMDGTSADRFDIGSHLTYAQITVITARLHHLLSGGDGVLDKAGLGEPWYRPAQEYLTEALAGDGEAAYLLDDLAYLDNFADQACDRYDFVWYLAAVLPEEALEPINHIPSLPDVTDADILRFYRAGILTGSDDKGTFNGFDLLSRGQAAAMLARIADPALRVSFTLNIPCYTRKILSLEPEAVMLTVDGWDVTADMYLYFLASKIRDVENQQAYGYFDAYPQYLEEYMADAVYTGSFEEFLLERYGIDVTVPVDWNAPDRGGMTPAEKVLQDTLDDIRDVAVLMARQQEYPLTREQETALEEALRTQGIPYGFSEPFYREMLTALYLTENLAEQRRLTSAEATELLAGEGYVYAQYAAVVRDNYESDEDARAAAQEVRQKLTAHLSDPEYVEFLLWKYSDSSDITADLLELDILSEENRKTVEDLGSDRVSPVLAEDGVYLVVVKRDPMSSRELSASLNAAAAQLRLSQWAEDAQITVSDAYEALDVAAIAQALAGLNF